MKLKNRLAAKFPWRATSKPKSKEESQTRRAAVEKQIRKIFHLRKHSSETVVPQTPSVTEPVVEKPADDWHQSPNRKDRRRFSIRSRPLSSTKITDASPASTENLHALRPSPISRIPEELLHLILVHVKNRSTLAEYQNSLLCCYKWLRIGAEIVFRDPVWHVRPNTGEVVGYIRPDENPEQIKNLSVQFVNHNGFGVKSVSNAPDTLKRIRAASSAISKLKHLTSFSFRIVHVSDQIPIFWFAQRLIEPLLNFPPTLTSLEIDTMGGDTTWNSPGHLCEKISTLIPQLHNLRLCLAYMCPSLFESLWIPVAAPYEPKKKYPIKRTSALRTCTLILGTPYESRSVIHMSRCDERDTPDPRTPLAGAMRALYVSGAFPHIKDLRLIDEQIPESSPQPYKSGKACALKLRDVIRNSTITVPWKHFNEDKWYVLATPPANRMLLPPRPISPVPAAEHLEDNVDVGPTTSPYLVLPTVTPTVSPPPAARPTHTTTYAPTTFPRETVIQSFPELQVLVEGPTAWLETASGSRFPHSFGNEGFENGYVFKGVEPVDVDTRTKFANAVVGSVKRRERGRLMGWYRVDGLFDVSHPGNGD
ncbi:hypothetical protein K402DRAFT_389732 [Aulographum hederae CBS 113979]|uniref:F-box domain-containing protein n=1 Tax=Aulographum hederae CBS 113979 TaxID=1176131 RepID=A0A6G1HCQ4_9PEZI|nr:hypothetical protein K402DRAFT_389732 [Aulographum hederae CBS 113979]